ncbi:MAG: glutamate racemase [Hyphomicrobiales bacterium]|nr:glutamate racemase [Hyphomicrobiales bacterium]MDE2114835.1 glutamate racemase [Hyphomicrobiales bacterium]
MRAPKVLNFDSGMGGLTVFAQLLRLRPDAEFIYCADDAGFPYGALSRDALIARVDLVMAVLMAQFAPDAVVIACNTASTAVLPGLRAQYPNVPFVGTVPAIKPAAQASQSRMISVLATPGTVARDYTAALVRDFSDGCAVQLVGSTRLAAIAEAYLRGDGWDEAEIAAEIAPAFVEKDGSRTDQIVLACTHYPLLMDALQRQAPWPVTWIDPAPAIARRTDHVLRELGFAPGEAMRRREWPALFTSGDEPDAALELALRNFQLRALEWRMPHPAKEPG